MRVFRATYKGRRGGKRETKKWYVELRDHKGRVRRLPAFTDKAASEGLGRNIQRLAELRASGNGPDRELARFVEDLPRAMRETLGRWGLIDARAMAGSKPLLEHVDDYGRSLRARGNVDRYVVDTLARIRAVLDGAEATFYGDLDPLKVTWHLANLRETGLGASTSNAYLRDMRAFLRWMVENGLANEDPLRMLKPINARTDRRRKRRAKRRR